MIKRYIFLIMLILLGAFSAAIAAFKDDGWGARPLGMGGAFTAAGDDVNVQLYNPAGIWQIEDFEATFMNAKLFTGLDKVDLGMNYAAIVMPTNGDMNIGVLWANLVSQDLYREDTFAVSAAMPVNNRICVGANLKYLSHAFTLDARTQNDAVFASGNSKSVFAADLGVQYIMFETKKYQSILGFAAKNVNQPDIGFLTPDIVPAEFRLGFAAIFYGKTVVSPAIDVTYRNQEWGNDIDKINVHAGCETRFFNELFSARAGANMNEITMGFGFAPRIKGLETRIDYAFIMPAAVKETSGTHRASLTLHFLPPDLR
jgi:hypothetical protein